MPGRRQRIILDTNLWISFLITKDFSRLEDIILSKKVTLLFSKELLEEFISVAQRSKFKSYFTQKDIEDILKAISGYANFVDVKSEITACRDEKDNFLLALAVDGKADYLVTGDKDLLDIGKIEETRIVTIADYLKLL